MGYPIQKRGDIVNGEGFKRGGEANQAAPMAALRISGMLITWDWYAHNVDPVGGCSVLRVAKRNGRHVLRLRFHKYPTDITPATTS